ncbi:MAG TPA: ABC transporter permease [Bryobacteraceae bacterium]|nr:ABC transporter permease [Bryobacteraceae bacterium]
MNRLRFFGRDPADAELHAELESYIDVATEENIARGMSREAARCAARRKLGNATCVREEVYLMNGNVIVDSAIAAVRYWLRTLRREPMFAAVAVLTLGLGIGAATAIFTVVNGVLLKPLPYPHPADLVAPGVRFDVPILMSPSLWLTCREQGRSYQSIGIYAGGGASVTGLGEPEQLRALNVTHGVLNAAGVPPLIGRWISREDDTPGSPEVAVLSYGYWQRRFGGDPKVLGRSLTVDDEPRQIVGVMPQSFDFMDENAEIILPLRFERAKLYLGQFAYLGIARLKPGVSIEQANAELAQLYRVWIESWPSILPGSLWKSGRVKAAVSPLSRVVLGDIAGALWTVMGAVGLVLLIACANVANLLLVRAEARQRDWGVRIALGAGKARILCDALAESILLAVAGGVLGLALAYAGVALLRHLEPANLPRLREIRVDLPVVAFAAAVSILAGLIFGLIPAWKYAGSRVTSRLRGALHDGGRAASEGREKRRAQRGLVVVQVALALVMLVTSGLLLRTFEEQRRVRTGFGDPRQAQTFRLTIPGTPISEPERAIRTAHDIVDKLAAIPGVTQAGFASSMPIDLNFRNNDLIIVEGRETKPGENPVSRRLRYISPGFLGASGSRLVAGRDLDWQDIHGLRNVVMVSENLARELWASAQAAIGKRIRDLPENPWREVVGVVEDVRDDGVEHPAPPIVYYPFAMAKYFRFPVVVQHNIAFAVRGQGVGTAGLMSQIRQAVWSVNSSLPLARVLTFQQIYAESMARTSFTTTILVIAAVMALLIGLVGIYGVIAYAVSLRRREAGIRLALGSRPRELQWMFVRSGLALTLAGVAVGLAGAAGAGKLIATQLFGVTPLDPSTYVATPLLLLVASVAACWFPARRAGAVDPAETLRSE